MGWLGALRCTTGHSRLTGPYRDRRSAVAYVWCIPPDASWAPHSTPSPPPPDLVLQSPGADRPICRVCLHRGHQSIASTPAGAIGSGTSLPPEIQPNCSGSFQSNQCCAWPSVESTGTSPSYEPTEGAERYKMPLGCPVAKESCSTSRRYQGCPGWLGSGGTGVSATAVRVDPSELVSAVYTQTVQRAPWLNSRWL